LYKYFSNKLFLTEIIFNFALKNLKMRNGEFGFYYIKIFIALAVLVNPLEGIPLFISKTRSYSAAQKLAISKKTSISVFLILLLSLFFGRYILQLFGISTASFSVSGGIIIFLIALDMVIGKSDSGEKSLPAVSPQQEGDIAIVPLAIPLLAGPGAISSIIVYGSRSTGIVEDIILSGIVLLVAVWVGLSLRAATKMEKVLSETGIKVMTKISGLLVAAIAVEMVFRGLQDALPQFFK
jgi:MarC family membrane protein